jgi:hypothetical protein
MALVACAPSFPEPQEPTTPFFTIVEKEGFMGCKYKLAEFVEEHNLVYRLQNLGISSLYDNPPTARMSELCNKMLKLEDLVKKWTALQPLLDAIREANKSDLDRVANSLKDHCIAFDDLGYVFQEGKTVPSAACRSGNRRKRNWIV